MIDEVKALRVEVASLKAERDDARKACAEMRRERDDFKEAHRHANETIKIVFEGRVKKAELERDALKETLNEINLLCLDVPNDGADWRKLVGDKARKALYGDPAWRTK